MSTLLERLNTATTYKDLQEVFSELSSQAQAGGENADLARTIDEAVRRLEQERTRDEQELRDIQTRYEEFKSDNKGVVGWFKRHIPFTETRKQEVGHREELADQQAEILADNLVIARAQIIKERILGPAQRRLGQRPLDWQTQLAKCETVDGLAPYAAALKSLSEEAVRSSAFVQALKQDIDAFAGASFKSKEDQQRRNVDYAAAQQELAVLEAEIKEESSLRQSGLKRLAALAATELSRTDSSFREDGNRAASLQDLLARMDEARAAAGRLVAAVGGISGLTKELTELPNETRKLREALQKAEEKRGTADVHCDKKTIVLEERQARMEDARRNLEQKQQLLQSAQQFYEAFQAEQRSRQAAGQPVESSADSPTVRHFQEAQAAAETAQTMLREAQGPFEQARKEAAEARAALDAAAKEIDDLRQKLSKLEQRGPQIRLEMNQAMDRTRAAFNEAAGGFSTYVATARSANPPLHFRPDSLSPGPYGWLSPNGLEWPLCDSLVQAERDPHRHSQAAGLLDRFAKWLETQRGQLDQERKAIDDRRTALWKRRCRELLGDAMAEEACAGGLPPAAAR
jgi:hypothetical protein